MNIQQEPCNYQSLFRSKSDLQHLLKEESVVHQSEDEAPIPPIQKRNLSQLSALDEKSSHCLPVQLRDLSDEPSAAFQDLHQRVPSAHSVPPPQLSPLSELRSSRSVKVNDLLNPTTSGDKTTTSVRQIDGKRTGSQLTVLKAATSGSTILSPHLNSVPPAAPASPLPPRLTSPLLALPREPQSFYAIPSTFGDKGLNLPTSGTTGKVRYETITIETKHSPIQVPGDMQTASEIADEKRKRNATASSRCRKRRKENEQEMSRKISDLEAQVWKLFQEIENYRQERDLLHDAIQQNRIPIPPLAPPPRQKRYASLNGPQDQDMGASASNGDRSTRRRLSEYAPQ